MTLVINRLINSIWDSVMNIKMEKKEHYYTDIKSVKIKFSRLFETQINFTDFLFLTTLWHQLWPIGYGKIWGK